MAWYPKAIRKPITKHDTPMDRYQAICNHVAVSEGMSLYGYFVNVEVCSHFYVRKTGKVEQYVDTRFRAPANYQGNDSLISIETQGGVHSAETEPWTPEQVQALAELHAWISKTHGIPLVLMKDSKASSRGVGYHKLGVDPWRVAGGELWSKSAGKICPGAKKISQIPTIIAKAKALVGNTTTEDELSAADVTNLKTYITDELERFFVFLEKPGGNLDQQLAHTETAVKGMVDEAKTEISALVETAKKEILEYTRVATVSIKDYVRQTDNEQDILNAVAGVKTDVAAVQADVDKLEAAAEAPKG